MFTRQNYKELGKVKLLNKSTVSCSRYYNVSFGKISIKVRVSDHYNENWKGQMQIVTYNPKNITINDVKGRAFEPLEKEYNRLLSKSKKPSVKTD